MEQTMTHAIASMTIINAPANQRGNRLLATFDLATAGFKITNCVLIEDKEGMTRAWGPVGKNHKGHKVSVQFTDEGTAREISQTAARAYAALSGCEYVGE